VATLAPALTAYANTNRFWINFTNANTVTNPTLNLNTLGAVGFVNADGSAIAIGALRGIVNIAYNGTNFQIVGNSAPYVLQANALSLSPADGITYFWGNIGAAPPIIATFRRIRIPKTGTITSVYLTFLSNGVGTTETSTHYIRVNNTTDYTIVSNQLHNSVWNEGSNTAMSVPVTAGDYIELKWLCPTWVTNPVGVISSAIIHVS